VPDAFPFRRLEADDAPTVRLEIEGRTVSARAGDTVAAVLLETGHAAFRETAVSGTPRGPFCMMGACFDCLVEIDGVPNRQACMTAVSDGMTVRRMQGARPVAAGGADAA